MFAYETVTYFLLSPYHHTRLVTYHKACLRGPLPNNCAFVSWHAYAERSRLGFKCCFFLEKRWRNPFLMEKSPMNQYMILNCGKDFMSWLKSWTSLFLFSRLTHIAIRPLADNGASLYLKRVMQQWFNPQVCPTLSLPHLYNLPKQISFQSFHIHANTTVNTIMLFTS